MTKHTHKGHESHEAPVEAPVVETPVETPVETNTQDAAAPEAPEEATGSKFGIADLAAALNLVPRRVRQLLRKAEVARTGRLYGWDTQEELDEVVAKLKEAAVKKAEPAEAGEAKPKKARGKKAAPVAEPDPELGELQELDDLDDLDDLDEVPVEEGEAE